MEVAHNRGFITIEAFTITTFFLFLANFKNQLKYYNTITLILYNVEVRKEKN